eukprot:6196092-Pleurochrysis_carterae.AAC.4
MLKVDVKAVLRNSGDQKGRITILVLVRALHLGFRRYHLNRKFDHVQIDRPTTYYGSAHLVTGALPLVKWFVFGLRLDLLQYSLA